MKLIRQAEVYAPEYLGKKDILVINDKIVAIEDQISGGFDQLTVEEIDGSSLIATPGFIDCHFHILGGGGEGGYQNRTPEVTLSQLTTAGVTTVVGCLGTDGVGRDMVALISKAKGLEAEGISTYVYDGSYRLPLDPVTDSLIKDFLTIDKMGGTIDFTASEDPDFWEREDDEVRFSKGLKRLLDEGIGLDQFTMTSDGQGSLPYFDENNQFIGLGVGSSRALMVGIKEAVQVEQIPLEIALRAITSNPAKILKLAQKGRIAPGMDADLCLLNQDTLDVETVIAKGKVMVDKKDVKVWGTFEQLV
ncbi:amidohydrolase family protein [Enterococcus gallinarum]|uniref:amidohydrolase family protein n=1 Tax=Enterococcus gallinarum TaxID=1353 RepID=UPI002DBFEF2A|nr:amidohydrolase family protein [Enterococcus gallinarum]MEB5969040.1 amidohydrolase family protein [Enterococcus gallinarum]